MKAKFFFLGLCALGLMACSIDEVSRVNDTNAIQFKATTATRAAATTTNNISAFSVWAWNTVEGVTGSTEFMDGVTASKNGSVFTTSPLYFWPTGTVDFYAISPVAETFGIEADSVERAYFGGELNAEGDDEGNSWTYTGNVAKATVANDNIVFDVVIPSKASDQIDLCYAITKGQSSGSVAMNFRHALSQVVFKARNTNSALDIDIQGVSVCSVFKEGTFTLKEVASTTADITEATEDSMGSWDYETESHKARFEAGITPQTLSGVSEEAVTLTTTADGSATGSLMLLPQSVVAWDPDNDKTDDKLGSYIAVLCRVTENGSLLWPNANETGNTETVGGVECAYIAVPVDIDWEAGYCYTYTIIFGDGLGYYPPDDTNFDLEGTEVLVPITFTVTVDEFQDTSNKYVSTEPGKTIVANAADLRKAVESKLSPIEIAEDIDLENHLLLIDYDCELTIDAGCTLTGPDGTSDDHIDWDQPSDYYAIIYVNGGNLTIYGEGTVETGGTSSSDYTNAIWVTDGSVTIYGGTYKGSNWNGETSDLYTRSAVYCGDDGYAYIYGGDFYAGPSDRNANQDYDHGYHWVLNCHNSSWEEGKAMIYCYGGTYHDGFDPANLHVDDAPSYVADGYWSVYDEESNSYTVEAVPTTTPLSVSTAANLRDAVNAGASDITVTAESAITLDGEYLDFTSDCTLTLEKGAVITATNATDNEYPSINGYNGYTAAICVTSGTLTINGEGSVVTTGGSEAKGTEGIWVNGGEVIINGGTYKGGSWSTDEEGSESAVFVEYGAAYIYGGTFSSGKWKDNLYYVLNCMDSPRREGLAWIYVYGGLYYMFDPSNCNSEGSGTNFVVDGYSVTANNPEDDWYTVTESD